MIARAEGFENERKRNHEISKWAVIYLEMLHDQNASFEEIEKAAHLYWENSAVLKFYRIYVIIKIGL